MFPLRDDLLSHWACWLASEGKIYATVKNYFYDLAAYQTIHHQGPQLRRADLPLLDTILKSIQNQPHTPLNRRPITRQHLWTIRQSLNLSTIPDAVIWAAACSALYGLMRTCEFTTRDGLQFDPQRQARRLDFKKGWDPTKSRPFWSLHLPKTKTGTPGEVFLGFSGEFDCPCHALDNMFKIQTSNPSDPAFNLGPGIPLSRSTFIEAIRKPLTSANLSGGIHGHSFRIGGATLLAAAGYPDHVIQLAGRWHSLAFLRYIRRHDRILPQTVAILATQPFPSSWQNLP